MVCAMEGWSWGDFANGLVSNLVAGLILGALGAVLVQGWLARRDETRERKAIRKVVLRVVEAELDWNRDQTVDLLGANAQGTAPAVLYTVVGWDLLRQERVLTAVSERTIEALIEAYHALLGVIPVHRLVSEHLYGATVTLVEALIAQQPGPDQRQQQLAFKAKQQTYFADLTRHVQTADLPAVLDRALVAVRAELEKLKHD